MMALKVLRALYPARFQRRFGDEFEQVAIDLLEQARARGPLSLAWAWVSLFADALVRAPVAHALAAAQAVVGTPPVLAGLGPGAAALALGRHWVVRPLGGVFSGLARHGLSLMGGALAALFLHGWLHSRAQVAMAQQLSSEPHLARQVAATWPYEYVAIVVAVAAMMWVHSGALDRHLRAWKAAGFPVAAPALCAFLGLLVGLHVILVSSFPGWSREVASSFMAYPAHRDIPAPTPREDKLEDWTPAQRQWFHQVQDTTLDAQGHPVMFPRVRPEKLADWCAIKMANLQAQEVHIKSAPNVSTPLTAMLWNGQLSVAADEGCLSLPDLMSRQTAMANWVVAHPAVQRLTWEPLAFLPGLFGPITAADYITAPLLHPRVAPYCHLVGAQLARKHNAPSSTGPQGTFNHAKASTFCAELDKRWRATHLARNPLPEPSLAQRVLWKLAINAPAQARHHAQAQPRLGPSGLGWIERQLRANPELWTHPAQ